MLATNADIVRIHDDEEDDEDGDIITKHELHEHATDKQDCYCNNCVEFPELLGRRWEGCKGNQKGVEEGVSVSSSYLQGVHSESVRNFLRISADSDRCWTCPTVLMFVATKTQKASFEYLYGHCSSFCHRRTGMIIGIWETLGNGFDFILI
jgi:hypothetical protein